LRCRSVMPVDGARLLCMASRAAIHRTHAGRI
jgi:hypothetical protein